MRHYPHLWISARGLGPSGTSTHLTRQLSGTHYGSIRPSAPRRYSRLAVFAAWASPLASERLVPAVPRKSLHPIHAPSTPVAVCPVIRTPDRLVRERIHVSRFDDAMLLYDASSKGSLSFVSRMLTCPRSSLSFSPNAHHHGSLPQQLGVV